jgi:hypothetical protein
VSANVPSRPGQRAGNQAQNPQADQAKEDSGGVDWKLAGGIALASLLLILGALRERVRWGRLLPQPQ